MFHPNFTTFEVAAAFFEEHPHVEFVSFKTLENIASKCTCKDMWYNDDISECMYNYPDIFQCRRIGNYSGLERVKSCSDSKIWELLGILPCDTLVKLKQAAKNCEMIKIEVEV